MLMVQPHQLNEWFGFCQKLSTAFPTINFDAALIPALQEMPPQALTAFLEELTVCSKFPPTPTFLQSCLFFLPLATTLK
jgi:hypothetical protein